MNEEPPKFIENVDDPTHPAGNQELAYEMAHAEDDQAKNLRDVAAEKRQEANTQEAVNIPRNYAEIHRTAAKADDELADKIEEQKRQEYLSEHPEISETKKTDDAAVSEVGSETLEHAGVADPNEQANEGEDRLRQDEPKSRIVDEETAQVAAEKAEPIIDMIDNIKKGDLPEADKRQMLAELEYNLDNLIIEAQERHKRTSEQLSDARRMVTADLAAVVSGKIGLEKGQTRSVLTLIERKELYGVEVNPAVGRSSGLVAPEDVPKLRDTLFTLVGAEGSGDWHEARTSAVYTSPEVYNANGGGFARIEQAAVNSNLKGFKVLAERAIPANGSGWEERIVLQKI